MSGRERIGGAERQRRYNDRKRAKRGVLHAECDLPGIADLLHAEGYLPDWRTEDRAELSRALSSYLRDLLRITGHATDEC